MVGMNSSTGEPLSGIDHVRQSIIDILTTPIGSRVMRREYGSRIWDLVDKPMVPATILDIYAATVEAIATWEPRVAVLEVLLNAQTPGTIVLDLVIQYLPTGEIVSLDGVEVV